jgi:hypothetical protein
MAGRRKRGGLAALVVAVTALVLALPARAQDGSLEYAVKAAFLYKLGPFVEWPANAFADATGPVNLCIAGTDPFGAVLDQAVAGQSIGTRPVAVTRLLAPARNLACHILYLGTADPRLAADALALVRGTPVLTVTDGIRDPAAKGIINFVILANRVRFEIDEGAASENRLVISSKVLSLAVSVRPRS